jgi:two-component system cell cycle sensor histidine kinase PleC
LTFFSKATYVRSITFSPMISLTLGAALVLIILASSRLDRLSYENFDSTYRSEVSLEMLNLRRKIEGVLIQQSLVLRELATLIGGSPDITQAEFSSWVKNIRDIDSAAITIAAAPNLVVSMIYPFAGNEKFLGFDYHDSAALLPGIMDTLGEGEDLMVGPVELPLGGLGVILRAPVHIPGEGTSVAATWGIVSVVLDYQRFIDNVGLSEAALSYDVLIDFSVPSNDTNDVFFGDIGVVLNNPIIVDFDFPYGALRLQATPKGGWPKVSPTQGVERVVMALAGIGLLWLLGYILWLAETRKLAKMQLTDGIEALDDGIVMFDKHDRLILCNKKFGEIYDLSAETLRYGTPISEVLRNILLNENFVLGDKDVEEWKKIVMQARRGGPSAYHSQALGGDGRVIKFYARPMQDGGYVGLCVDVTDLDRAKVAAEAANQAKTDFIAVLSHELRTPMTVVLGVAHLANHVQLLKSSKSLVAALEKSDQSLVEIRKLLDEMFAQLSSLMGRMIQSGDHLMLLIDELLDFAKIEAGCLSVNHEICDICDIVDPIAQQLSTLSHEKGLVFEVTQASGIVFADKARVQQILLNLVGNAIKFTKSGFVQLSVKLNAGNVIFEVKDSGAGIPKSELNAIFDPFYQVDSTASRPGDGTGMGLAISRDLAELHGGTLTVTSNLEEGSCFTLTLPNEKRAFVEKPNAA